MPTPRALAAAEQAANFINSLGVCEAVSPPTIWEPGKKGIKPALRMCTWRILRDDYQLSLQQIAREASPLNPKTGKRYDHTTVLHGLRRYEDLLIDLQERGAGSCNT